MSKPAVVLLSGGLDSSTVVAMAQRDGWEVHALSFSYGQRHTVELESAKAVAAAAGITDHRIVNIDLGAFGGSALTDASIDVPKHDDAGDMEDGIPVTYVPARNTIFLSFALAFAEVLGSSDIFIGVNALDYSGYPDCRPEFIAAFQDLARIATKTGVEGSTQVTIHAPLMEMTKAQISAAGTELGVDYSITTSCYDADDEGNACGRCDACHLRHQGFVQAGLPDPTRYQPGAAPS
ncbi:MAG: queC [Ilumatobacteraceae bacterium]|nr:queC [Ilumatobacteraceae bacterium]